MPSRARLPHAGMGQARETEMRLTAHSRQREQAECRVDFSAAIDISTPRRLPCSTFLFLPPPHLRQQSRQSVTAKDFNRKEASGGELDARGGPHDTEADAMDPTPNAPAYVAHHSAKTRQKPRRFPQRHKTSHQRRPKIIARNFLPTARHRSIHTRKSSPSRAYL